MRTAFDSITAADIPAHAAIVCGYVDGIYRWSGADWARFPNAIKVGIAVSPFTNAGHVLDVETGDATPAQAPHWVLMRRAAGVDPTVYINRSNWAATRLAFQQQHVPEPHYWLAAYDNKPEIPAGTVAKQYADSAMAGGHYDLSAVADHWPGVDSSNPNATAGSEVIVQGGDMSQEQIDGILGWVAKYQPAIEKLQQQMDGVLGSINTQILPALKPAAPQAPHIHKINSQETEPA